MQRLLWRIQKKKSLAPKAETTKGTPKPEVAEVHSKKTPVQKTISVPTNFSQAKTFLKKEVKPEVKEPSQEEKTPIELIPTTSVGVFKQEMLDQYLPEVIELWKSEKRNLELAILQQVKKVEEGTIFIEVMGHVQEEIAEKMKPDLIGIFRKKSGAGKIAIQLDVKEEDDAGSPKLYTDQDKFKHLLKKHPALLEFSKKFDLDPDF